MKLYYPSGEKPDVIEDKYLLPGSWIIVSGDRLMFHSPDGAETWFTKELLGQAIVLLNKTEEA